MNFVLPAGQHYGSLLRKWESRSFTLSEVRYSEQAKHPLHANEQAVLAFVERGGYSKTVANNHLSCEKNSLVFIPAGRSQTDVFGSAETICLLVDCDPTFLSRMNEVGVTMHDATVFSGAEFTGLGTLLFREFKKIDCASALVFESLVLNIWASSFRAYKSSFGPKAPSWLLQAKALLRERLSKSFTINSIAREVGVHPVYLSHEFRRFFKTTPGEYLRRARVEFAAALLTKSDIPLSEIAICSGFADQAHFSRTFRQLIHQTPSEFRRQSVTC